MSAPTPIVLHVEDDANDVLLLQNACQRAAASFRLETHADVSAAQAYLSGEGEYADRARHPLPTLVLLDLKLPRTNGFELLAWIRSQPHFNRLPVVVLTSSSYVEDINRAYELGANSYLIKPVNFDALVEMVRAIDQYWMKLNLSAAR